MNGRRFAATLALLAVGGGVLGGCGGDALSADASTPSPSPSPSQPSPRLDGQPAALALARVLSSQMAWRYEPAGDLSGGREGASGVLVFAHLYAIREQGGLPVASFDAAQFYSGACAEREAARDGETIEGGTYVRNAHRHRQSLPLAADCPIVYAWDGTVLTGRWPDVPEVVPLSRTTYWLVVDCGEITAMVWEGY